MLAAVINSVRVSMSILPAVGGSGEAMLHGLGVRAEQSTAAQRWHVFTLAVLPERGILLSSVN